MKILVLTKRQYTGKDLIDDRYGRLFELPAELARRGHEVQGLVLSYRSAREGEYSWPDVHGLTWHSFNLTVGGVRRYRDQLQRLITTFKPDLIWSSSDIYQIMFASLVSRRHNIPLVVDLYDNYESFGLSRIPGLISPFRSACRTAAGVVTVSSTLSEWATSTYRLRETPTVIGNGISKEVFFPRDRHLSRQKFNLPQEQKLIGTAGAIARHRGIKDLFEAFLILAERDPELWLVFAGPRDSTVKRYRHERIIDLGILPTTEIPWLLSALDLAIVNNKDSSFGRFCFPQKLHEIIACGTPFLAAAVGEVARLLASTPMCLYPPDQPTALAKLIETSLQRYEFPNLAALEWTECGAVLEQYMLNIVAR